MAHNFTTLRHPVEKLLEAEYFLVRLSTAGGIEFQFELNAFLSACRSVTFVLQSAFSRVPGFAVWYEQRRAEMSADKAMGFFLRLRNLSQKAGPVSYVGGARLGGGWAYRFVHGSERVPQELQGRDVCHLCAEQLRKLAGVVADCADTFPFDACPVSAFTVDGMAHLGYSMEDVERALSLPAGYTSISGLNAEAKLRYLQHEIEPLDRANLARIADGDFRNGDERLTLAEPQIFDLLDDVAALIDPGIPSGGDMRTLFLRAIAGRIKPQG